MRPQGTPQSLEKRRLQAVRLLKAGKPYRDVAMAVSASLSSVVRWQQAFRSEGKRGLRVKPSPGRTPLLNQRQKERLVRLLLQGPLEAGYTTNLWTLRRIGEVIRREFGISYTVQNVWKLMRAMGWSCQIPDKRARERNEQAIRYWKRHVWPRIKKNRSTWSPFGLPR
ncbi:MAG: winged helix-turn-helix domain-containing protein [Ignavibacteriales bacterium]|nr:winged helix-turn-helix domain-containing protein [Ignavibacteriales bacterium]